LILVPQLFKSGYTPSVPYSPLINYDFIEAPETR
jgi:hypothetical protein